MKNSLKFAQAVKGFNTRAAQVTFYNGCVEVYAEINTSGSPVEVWMWADGAVVNFMNPSVDWVKEKTKSGIDILVANMPCEALWDLKDSFKIYDHEDHANILGLEDYLEDN